MKTSYTQHTPITVIPCSLHSIAMVTITTVPIKGGHSVKINKYSKLMLKKTQNLISVFKLVHDMIQN